MKSKFYFACVLLTLISLSSCSEPTSSDTHSAGKTVIYVEESFKPLF